MSARSDRLYAARQLAEKVLAELNRSSKPCLSCRCARHEDKDEWQIAEGVEAIVRKLDALSLRLKELDAKRTARAAEWPA